MAKARWKQIAQAYACPVCPAGPGSPCITMNGNAKVEVHADRTRLASANGWKDPDGEGL